MADYKLTLAEKETIVLWSEADDTVRIDTFSQKLINRLHKAKEKAPELYRVDEPDKFGGVYAEVPKTTQECYKICIAIIKEKTSKNILSSKIEIYLTIAHFWYII